MISRLGRLFAMAHYTQIMCKRNRQRRQLVSGKMLEMAAGISYLQKSIYIKNLYAHRARLQVR